MSEPISSVEQARDQYGKVVVFETERGDVCVFRRYDRAGITNLRKLLGKTPELALDILTNSLLTQCVLGAEAFKAYAAENPMAVDDLSDVLMKVAQGAAKVSVQG